MKTRRDQVQAHGFMVGRLSTAMLEADPDALEAPMRRTRTGTAIGLVLALLIGAGFLVYGLVFPGGATSWRTEGTVIAVKGGGGRYVYSDSALWPVANQASALLLGSGDPVQVSAASLEGTPVASPIGIPGAPDAVPAAGAEKPLVWQVCAVPVATGAEDAPRALTALSVGRAAAGEDVAGDRAVLAAGPDGSRHLLWGGERLRLDGENGAAEALGYGTSPAHPVSAQFLAAVPEGPELTAPDIAGLGEDGPEIGGERRRVGQVFTVEEEAGGREQYYVLERDGLAPVGAVLARLLLAAPDTAAEAYGGGDAEAVPLGVAELRPHLSDREPENGGLPAEPPELAGTGGAALCAVERGGGETGLALRAPASITARAADPPAGSTPSCTAPDLIGVRSGEGGLVLAAPAGGGAARGSYFLVTDTGAKYPVPDSESAEKLGHPPSTAQQAPAALLDMLPTGPELSTAAAAEPAAAPPPPGEPDCPE
ncbi:type VII secretion protein EccB [Nocardiopsis composta]|uniref:Type VII secretion protein EccB n=1 Tax=Nocardiopsis composta TaxID=157465 RepID=A0A7W8VFP4_9ACTN|nr:type VII secretion protein EccB [Nocardiopsis composta]MBB5434169.1 type VII secretion protein EccB [Nocardiopsis composta]